MASVGNTFLRAASAVLTLGASEVTRKKPFQPGGDENELSRFGLSLAGPAGGAGTLAIAEGVKTYNKLKEPPPPPKLIKAFGVSDKVVQQAVSEVARRRQRARGYRSTILSQNFMKDGGSSLPSASTSTTSLKQTIGA